MKRAPPICSNFVPSTGCRSDLDSPHGQKGAVRGKPVALPAQTPDGGGANDAQGLLLRRVGQDCCRDKHEGDRCADGHARSVERKDYLSKTACRISNTPANVRSHSSFTMAPQCPLQVCAARFSATCLRDASIFIETGFTHLLHVGLRQSVWTKIAERHVIGNSATGELVPLGNQGLCQGACTGHNTAASLTCFR